MSATAMAQIGPPYRLGDYNWYWPNIVPDTSMTFTYPSYYTLSDADVDRIVDRLIDRLEERNLNLVPAIRSEEV